MVLGEVMMMADMVAEGTAAEEVMAVEVEEEEEAMDVEEVEVTEAGAVEEEEAEADMEDGSVVKSSLGVYGRPLLAWSVALIWVGSMMTTVGTHPDGACKLEKQLSSDFPLFIRVFTKLAVTCCTNKVSQ